MLLSLLTRYWIQNSAKLQGYRNTKKQKHEKLKLRKSKTKHLPKEYVENAQHGNNT